MKEKSACYSLLARQCTRLDTLHCKLISQNEPASLLTPSHFWLVVILAINLPNVLEGLGLLLGAKPRSETVE